MPGYPQWFSCALQDVSRASPLTPAQVFVRVGGIPPENVPPEDFFVFWDIQMRPRFIR